MAKLYKSSLLNKILFLALMLTTHSVWAQDLTVRGKIIDASNNEGLPGVNIVVKGSASGTTTDMDGAFSINVPANGTLVVSFIGYTTQELPVDGRTIIDVSLAPSAEQLSEVVVVGYGSVEKKDVTGGIAKVNSGDFNKGLINGADQLIAGKVAGLQIVPGAEPGGGSAIRLRGVSINGEFPLVVVDGVPLDGGGGGVIGGRNPLSLVNPSDIADMTVLKDASASAIYGARGANGVIIITTKSGKAGKMKISYNGFYSMSLLTRKPDFLSPEEFRAAINAKAPQELPNLGTNNTDWMKEVTQVAQSMQHTVSLSGGKNKTNYFGSVNYLQNSGVLRFTENKKLNLSLKVEQKLLDDNLTLSLNTKNTFTSDLYGPNVMGTAAGFDPTRPVLDPSNTLRGGYFQWLETLAPANPVASQDLTDNHGSTFRTLTNLMVQYNIPFVKGLSLKANFGYDYTSGKYTGLTLPQAKEGADNGGTKMIQDETKTNQLYEYFATYKNTFNKHAIEATIGYAWQNFNRTFQQIAGDSVKVINGEYQYTYSIDTLNFPVENRLISMFGRVNYEFDGKYIITGSLRRDGSTKFGPSNRWGLFPAVAVAWRVLEEGFASGLTNVFNELKFRVSYGVTGNEQIPDYLYSTYYYPSYTGASYQFGNVYEPTIRPTGVDPNIKWEETVSTNIGMDAGFFGGRLTASLDFYNKDVNDLIFKVAVPAGSNLSDRVFTNIGQVNNKGVELVLSGVVVDRPDFKWNLGYNISYNKNVIVKLDNLIGDNLKNFAGYESGSIAGDVGQTIQRRKVGEAVDAYYVYQHKRNPDGSLVLDVDGDGFQEDIEMYNDINNDGIINENDRVIYKKPNPDVLMGLTSNTTYKRWDLSFTLKGSFGNYMYNNVASANGFFQRLTQVVTNNIHATAFETNFKQKQSFSDYYVQDGSFVKLTNVSLGYNFPDFSFGRVRAYLAAQNVFTITKYKGVDPEIFNGIDNNLYPRSITMSIGVDVTFK
ncbi:MAG: TonB-dependent receptor [Cyclobacteriaceae bacterium]|nr:TonB-dependent receptor [Cyclobacteriaceae bacterium]